MRLEDIFNATGPLARQHPAFEARRQQVQMAHAVADAMHKERHLAVQAGTGLGKTFAYLIPAIIFARQAKKRIVVTTKTLNLQEQIFKKDVPFLQAALQPHWSFTAVLAKGRGNYVCLRKMNHISGFDRGLLTQMSEVMELRRLQQLVQTKEFNGDRENMPFAPTNGIWQHVCGEGDNCLRRACASYHGCYYYRARRAQLQADIVVANHALFFADLAVRKDSSGLGDQTVLEDYDAVIFDEAHHLEDVATDFFSRRVAPQDIRRTALSVISSARQGLLSDGVDLNRALEGLAQRLMQEADIFFDQFPQAVRLMPHDRYPHTLKRPLVELAKGVAEFTAGASEEQVALGGQLCQRLVRMDDQLAFILERQGGDHDFAYWVERGDSGSALVAAPVSMETELREQIFQKIPTAVLTSATLSSVLLRRVGLDKCEMLRLDSPFDYANNALLYLPGDACDPNDSGFDDYAAAKIAEIVRVTRGRALVLFTSFKSMQAVHLKLCALENEGFTVLIQGSDSRHALMQRFTAGGKLLLLAVASFWEGIDVPGEALSCVILVRLPFAVPTEPITQARMEALERQGADAFHNYSLPQAILRLKQGFGRLIRTADDKGVVVILDSRVQKKRYGRAFLRELPPARPTHSLDDVAVLLS